MEGDGNRVSSAANIYCNCKGKKENKNTIIRLIPIVEKGHFLIIIFNMRKLKTSKTRKLLQLGSLGVDIWNRNNELQASEVALVQHVK